MSQDVSGSGGAEPLEGGTAMNLIWAHPIPLSTPELTFLTLVPTRIANDAASTDDNAWPDRGRAIKPGKLRKRLTPSRISAGVDERYLDPPLFPVNTLHRFFDQEGSAGAASTHMEQAPTLSVARDRPQQE
jgi:hypothetical protein